MPAWRSCTSTVWVQNTRTYIKGQLWCSASSLACFVYQQDRWYVQSAALTWVSLRVPQGATVELNGIIVEHEAINGIVRLQVPSGTSAILFK